MCYSCAQVRMLLQWLSTCHCRQVCLDWTFEMKGFSATYNLKCLSLPTEGRKSFQKFPTECCKGCISRILFLSNEMFPNDLSSLLLLLVNFSLIKFPYLVSFLQFHISKKISLLASQNLGMKGIFGKKKMAQWARAPAG